MKKILFMLIFVFSINAWGQDNKFSLGINTGIGTEPDNSLVWGLVARYNVTKSFRIAPEFNLAFREVEFVTHQDEWTNWTGNINFHYLFSYKNISLYPIAGISFTNGKDKIKTIYLGNQSIKMLRLGGSLGAGIEYDFLNRFYINGEAKYSILHKVWNEKQYITTQGLKKNLNNFSLSIGIGYKF